MASIASSIPATPRILRTVSSRSRAVSVTPGITVLPASSTTGNRKVAVVVRAQKYEGEPKKDISRNPFSKRPVDPDRVIPFFDTSRYEQEPLKMEESSDATEIWLRMPGVGVMDIYMYVKDNKIYIKERDDLSPFRKMMIQPFESIQLPPDSEKHGIIAKLGNGMLYIHVPKVSKDKLPFDIPIENVPW